ncbi:hypothetical protein [Microcoleus sp. B5-D4]
MSPVMGAIVQIYIKSLSGAADSLFNGTYVSKPKKPGFWRFFRL